MLLSVMAKRWGEQQGFSDLFSQKVCLQTTVFNIKWQTTPSMVWRSSLIFNAAHLKIASEKSEAEMCVTL